MSTSGFAEPGMALLAVQTDGTAVSWWLLVLVVVLSLSLAGNFFGLVWSIWRELHVRMLNDTIIEAIHNAGDALNSIRTSLADVCNHIDNNHQMSQQAKVEIRNSLDHTEQNIDSKLQLLAQLIQRSGVSVTNQLNSEGQGQIGENSGGVHKH